MTRRTRTIVPLHAATDASAREVPGCEHCQAWRERALHAEAEVARLRARGPAGRPAGTRNGRVAKDAKTQIVNEVCAALALNRGELAARLSEAAGMKVDVAYLSPGRPFPKQRQEEWMAALRAMVPPSDARE